MLKHRLRRLETLVRRGGRSADEQKQSAPRRLQTPQDVIDLLEEQIELVRAAPWVGTLHKARAIGFLAGIARKAIEAGTLAARLELLETVLKQRKR